MNSQINQTLTSEPKLTQHAMLVAWGRYAEHIGLVSRLEELKLHQKTRAHRPHTKVLEFFVAILAGYAHLQEISRSAHPLDQDEIVAEAWGQRGWADYSGVSRTLHRLSEDEANAIVSLMDEISAPFIKREIELALQQTGYLVYDGDLTGRPVSSTSTTYPDTAFGYMGDTIQLGYQSALVSLHSPSYGRLWLSTRLHPGDTVSMTQAQALVRAAEARTGVAPQRRLDLVAIRLQQADHTRQQLGEKAARSEERLLAARAKVQETTQRLNEAGREVTAYEAEYQRAQRQPTSHCKLIRARRRLTTYQQRLPRNQSALALAEQRTTAAIAHYAEATTAWQDLCQHATQLQADLFSNPAPVRVVLRLDAGFASRENLAWLLEMGYELYTKSRSATVRETLLQATPDTECRQRVGKNASLVAWPMTTVNDYFPYPFNVALAAYQLGETTRHSVLLHYGSDPVTSDLKQWFHFYNGRQSIEAGIKEGKGVFQMHHLKVRSPAALRLQDHFAAFAANFVRFSAAWFVRHQFQLPTTDMGSVKQMVRVGAHTSAWVHRHADVWFLTFTDHSFYAGQSLYLGNGPLQLPLPLFTNFYF